MEDPNTSGDKTNKPKPGHRQRIRESDHIKLLQRRIEAKGIPRTVMKVLIIFRGKKRQWLCLTGHSIVLGNTTMFLLSALSSILCGNYFKNFPHLWNYWLIILLPISLISNFLEIINKSHQNLLNFLLPTHSGSLLLSPPFLPSSFPSFIYSVSSMYQALW